MSTNENTVFKKMDEKCTEEEKKRLHITNSHGPIKTIEKLSIWSQITLEPMWIGISISMIMGLTSLKNFFLQKACLVDLGYSEEVCFRSEGAAKVAIEMETQKLVSSLGIYSGFMSGLVTSALLIFLGPWSDSCGRRKPLMIMPMVGSIIASLGLLISQAFPNAPTVLVIFVEAVPLAIGGNFALLTMAGFSHLGDICFKTGRCVTTVVGSNSAVLSVCMICGSMFAPILYRTVGFVGMFGISVLLELTSLAYVIWRVHDVNVTEKVPSIFDLTLPYQAWKCVFKKREGNRRKMVVLMVIVPCFHTVIAISDLSISYLYLRNKFDWTDIEYGTLLSSRNIMHLIGTLLIIKILKHKFNLRDEVIGVIGGVSQLIFSVAFMLSSQPWMLFASSIFGIFKSGVMIAERPVLNKQITASEQGKIISITTVLEKFTSFFTIPLSNYIYNMTMTWMPSSFLMIGVLASVLQITCFAMVEEEPTESELKEKESKV